MKVLLVGKNSKDIAGLVKDLGFSIVTQNPEVVISYGGDGTLLYAERQYPQVPKLPIRDDQICKKCSDHQTEALLKHLLQNKLELKEYRKLHTNLNGKDLFALNDFVVRNEQTIHAIRFQVTSEASHPERSASWRRVEGSIFIGDGIVVTTPFGSRAYFKSITGESFDAGFGLAFNNTTEKINPIYLDEDDTASFKLLRGRAVLTSDNNPDILHISEGTTLSFKLSNQVAKIYQPESLRCSKCKIIRD